jgi:ABC-type Fe3+ transport system permease subunit/sugar lactone lactonase YvrE
MSWLLLRNSLLVGGLTTMLAGGFGFIAALWLAGLGDSGRLRVSALAILALALPPFLVTNCWLDLLGSTGVWHHWLPFNIFSLGGTTWILSLMLWPIAMFATWSAWSRLERTHLECDPAVTGWNLIRLLLFPLARISVGQAAVLTFVLALNNFAVPAILQVKVFPAEMWVRFNTTFDVMGALRLSWPLLLAPTLLLVWFSRREFPWPRLDGAVAPELFRRQLGSVWVWCCGVFTGALCVISVGAPLGQLVLTRRTWTELPGALAAGFGASWNSALFAAVPATAVLALGIAVALDLSSFARSSNSRAEGKSGLGFPPLLLGRRGPGRGGRFFLFRPPLGWRPQTSSAVSVNQRLLSSAPTIIGFTFGTLSGTLIWLAFLVPGVLLGIGLIQLFNRPWAAWFYPTAGIVILAFVIRYFALGWYSVLHSLHTVDPDLADDARLNGATRWQMFRFVQWPQIAPAIRVIWYVVFLLCLWDVESMILVVPPGGETLALRIFNLLHYGHNAQVNALCLTLLGLALAPLLGWQLRSLLSGHPTRNTEHGTRILLLFACLLLPLTSCSPPSTSNETPLPSHIFGRVQIIGSRGVGLGELNKPRSVAVDKQDNLYVVDMTGRLQKFSPNGVFVLSRQLPQTDLGKPKGMGCDGDGNIIVVEPHYQRVNHFSPDGNLLAQWGEKGTNVGQFMLPRAVAVNSRGEIYVSEYGAMERVQQFAISNLGAANSNRVQGVARFVRSFGRAGIGPGEFNRPEGLCVDAQDRLYVADSCNHRIQVFSREGQFIRAYGKAGSGKGELSYPYDICVDSAGRQYVCEFGNSRIQVFDANDQPLEIIGGPGVAPGRFSNPWSAALDSAGDLYVADSQNHRVQKLIRRQSITQDPEIVPAEAPRSKIQAAETLQTPNSEWDRSATPDRMLDLGAFLEPGGWCLEVSNWR